MPPAQLDDGERSNARQSKLMVQGQECTPGEVVLSIHDMPDRPKNRVQLSIRWSICKVPECVVFSLNLLDPPTECWQNRNKM
jgi:hypothetical protein